MIHIANIQSSKILEPGKQPLYPPSLPIFAQFSPILCGCLFSSRPMGSDQLYTSLVKKLFIKLIAIVSLIANKAVRRIAHKTSVDRCLDKLHCMGRSAFKVREKRKTRSVRNGHDIGAFAAFCRTNSKTPFFAGTNVLSIKASRMSISPRSYKLYARLQTMPANTPCLTHCWKRLCQVWYGGYLSGKSFQGAPVLKIHAIYTI